MNLYYELLRYPVFSMKEVKSLYSSERTARAALENQKRFPEDFCFQLTEEEYLRCQNGISKDDGESMMFPVGSKILNSLNDLAISL